jgi:hypothetical protein
MAPVLGTSEETIRRPSLQERLDELFAETVQLRGDLMADRISVKKCDGRHREILKKLQKLEREIK